MRADGDSQEPRRLDAQVEQVAVSERDAGRVMPTILALESSERLIQAGRCVRKTLATLVGAASDQARASRPVRPRI